MFSFSRMQPDSRSNPGNQQSRPQSQSHELTDAWHAWINAKYPIESSQGHVHHVPNMLGFGRESHPQSLKGWPGSLSIGSTRQLGSIRRMPSTQSTFPRSAQHSGLYVFKLGSRSGDTALVSVRDVSVTMMYFDDFEWKSRKSDIRLAVTLLGPNAAV